MSEEKKWSPEGVRKLIMVGLGIVGVVAVLITWMIVQPEGVELGDLMTWVGGLITTLTGLGVGGNVLEHRAKSQGTGGALLLVLLAVALTGCAGSGDVTVGDLIPEAQISREGGCLKVVVDQPVPAPEGWEATTRVTVRQDPEGGCGESSEPE